MTKVNYYTLLGLDIKATDAEIRNNYRKLARLYHPDLNKGKMYHEKFVAINQAYSVLRDETSRRAYDYTLREQEKDDKSNVTFSSNYTPRNKETVTVNTNTAPSGKYYQKAQNSVQDKNRFTVHYKLAVGAFNEKSYVKAMKEIDLALDNMSKSDIGHELKGDIFMVYANYQEARKEYELALEYCKKSNLNRPKLEAKLKESLEKMKPEKKNIFSRLKRKLFETEE